MENKSSEYLSSVIFKRNDIVMSQDYLAYYNVMGGYHPGIDFACGSGTPVYSPFSGKITVSGDTNKDGSPDDKYGSVIMEISVRPNEKYCFIFAHLSVISTSVNLNVSCGDLIGYSGKTGTKRPHLHVECRVSGRKTMAMYFKKVKDNKTNFDPRLVLSSWEDNNISPFFDRMPGLEKKYYA